MAKHEYDLAVIGAGAAGSTAATTAAAQGKKVVLIERDKMGGTCLNYGCDPTKTMLYSAHLLHEARRARFYGLNVPQAEVEWKTLMAHVQQVIKQIRGGTPEEAARTMEEKGVDFIHGEAHFVNANELEVSGRRLSADQIIIAGGSKTTVPPVEGLKEAGFITNLEAVALPELPRRLAVLGGGPIGMEFAQLFRRFGAEVTVIERSPNLLDTEDRELAEILAKLLSEEGIHLRTSLELTRMQRNNSGKCLTLKSDKGEEELVVDEILVAVGREPALESLNLKVTGVEIDKKGIKVDQNLRSSVPHIWAAGDIAGGYQFTHVAYEQGKQVAQNAFADSPEPFDDKIIPWVTYTYPALAHVGQTEEQLREDKIKYKVGRMRFAEVERAVADGQTEGLVKLLVDDLGKILGCHILGVNAGSLLAPVILAMKARISADTLASTILPYPTMAEGVRWAADRVE